MRLFVIILSVYIFIKSISYAIYEYKNLNNKPAGITIIVTSILTLIITNIIVWIR